eukprot:147496-Pyramimonas_sp.AAC.1
MSRLHDPCEGALRLGVWGPWALCASWGCARLGAFWGLMRLGAVGVLGRSCHLTPAPRFQMGGASEPLVVKHMPPSIDAITPIATYGDPHVATSTDAAYRWLQHG